MTIRHMRIFVAVCETGGMTKAGDKLYLTQPVVSVAIAELEKYYGAMLFDRIAKRLYLTEAGRVLLQYARHIIALFDEADAAVRDSNGTGTLRIGSSVTIGHCLLPAYLHALNEQWPSVDVKVTIDNSEQIEEGVLENTMDIGLIEGMTHSPYLHNEVIQDDNLVLICAASHPWAARGSISVKEMANEPFLMREKGSGSREILESAMCLYEVNLKIAWESISTQAVVGAVAAGFGVAVLPRILIAEALQRGRIAAVAVDELSFNRQLSVIHHKNKYLTAAAKRFLQICRDSRQM